VNQYGKLKVLDDRDLVIEFERKEDVQALQNALEEAFGKEVDVELVAKG
jgi:predicted nucleotidyltransferase